jgi:hypothetical protein
VALRSEAAHEKGRAGVFATKAWLESTTHISLGFDAYDFPRACTVQCLNDEFQTFDLYGKFLSRKASLYVEVKSYDTVGHQPAAFQEFLAIAYSATARDFDKLGDERAEFMWVTTHPFAQSNWTKLTGRETIANAIRNDTTGLLNGEDVNEEILDLLAKRVWLLVLNERQHELALTRTELAMVQSVLDREKAGS